MLPAVPAVLKRLLLHRPFAPEEPIAPAAQIDPMAGLEILTGWDRSRDLDGDDDLGFLLSLLEDI
jgi:hypothetical protein